MRPVQAGREAAAADGGSAGSSGQPRQSWVLAGVVVEEEGEGAGGTQGPRHPQQRQLTGSAGSPRW
jgi:hypothetical protein